MKSQNLNKLNKLDKALIAWMFANHVVGWTYCYMIEVKLDAPGRNILEGGDGLVTHGGNGSRSYGKQLCPLYQYLIVLELGQRHGTIHEDQRVEDLLPQAQRIDRDRSGTIDGADASCRRRRRRPRD